MGFDRYRCVLDRIFSFPKLTKYRRRFCFQKYRIALISDEKYENESGGAFRLSFLTIFIPMPYPSKDWMVKVIGPCSNLRGGGVN